MSSITESSHANNVANFEELISYAIGYGAIYNPPKLSIKIAGLQNILNNSKTVSNAVNAALPAYRNAVDAREAAFLPLSKLIRRVMNFLKATDTTEQVDDSANTLVRKIIGTRATAKKTDAEKQILAAEGKEVKEISSSQMGYDNRLDNLDKLIKMLSSIPLYAPNEADLKVTALTALYLDLKAKNLAVATSFITLSNTRIARNDVMYKVNVGLYDISSDVKLYIKSVFGATSPQYKQISGLKFTKPR